MATTQLAIRFRYDFTDMINQLRAAADALEAIQAEGAGHPRTDRELIIDALRDLAPGHPVTRVWGRSEAATPNQAQEGNAWAADVEDIADLALQAIGRT